MTIMMVMVVVMILVIVMETEMVMLRLRQGLMLSLSLIVMTMAANHGSKTLTLLMIVVTTKITMMVDIMELLWQKRTIRKVTFVRGSKIIRIVRTARDHGTERSSDLNHPEPRTLREQSSNRHTSEPKPKLEPLCPG